MYSEKKSFVQGAFAKQSNTVSSIELSDSSKQVVVDAEESSSPTDTPEMSP
jgi:hypothetical protein